MTQNRAHLTPTTVTNKNGVQTTVYRKPQTATGSSTKLPKAAIPTSTNKREVLVQETVEALIDKTKGPRTKTRIINNQQLTAVLSEYSEATLHRLKQMAATGIRSNLNEVLCKGNPSEDYINDWLTIETADIRSHSNSKNLVNGLEKYNHLEPHQNDRYSARREEQVKAISRVTSHFINNYEGFSTTTSSSPVRVLNFIEDTRLRDLLTTHDDPTAIADIIISRNITKFHQISDLLTDMDQTSTAIRTGVL